MASEFTIKMDKAGVTEDMCVLRNVEYKNLFVHMQNNDISLKEGKYQSKPTVEGALIFNKKEANELVKEFQKQINASFELVSVLSLLT